jgi:Cu(I)/Ag(I) efflux system periplasmic protein CusF
MNRSAACALWLLLSLGINLPAAAQAVAGEVTRIDRAQAKLTLKHGPVPNLEMPAMTMAYRVKDPAWLDQLKVGDRVRFDADKVGGQFTVVRLTVQR